MTAPTFGQWAAVPALWAGVAGLIFGSMHGGVTAIGPALAVALGPLAGGYARDWQSCCAQNSLSPLRPALALWAPGVLTAFLLRASTPARRSIRRALWIASWASWFGAAVVSCLHALE